MLLKIFLLTKLLEVNSSKCFKAIRFYLCKLRDCINDCLLKGSFPNSLKLENITPVHEKDEPTDKENCRPVNVLPLLSKIFERLICDQLSEYLDQYLYSLLCGFRKVHSTQHALFRLLQE